MDVPIFPNNNGTHMFHQPPSSSQNEHTQVPPTNHHYHRHKITTMPVVAKQTTPHVSYKECLKNHAANMGMTATDGCGEFMLDDTSESLTCSACGCHRNFHRQVEILQLHYNPISNEDISRNNHPIFLEPHNHQHKGHYVHNDNLRVMTGKRFRTKFTAEQKMKMAGFAETIGWRMLKKDEDLVQQFCQEIGVAKRVFKVWMHNNKNIRLRTIKE